MSNLYIVATPIGNLEDITFRAVKVLREVDLIACEDTRRTKKLLDRYKINTGTISYHQHSKVMKVDYLLKLLSKGKNLALVSDAGTPAISDPGGTLVKKVVEKFKKRVNIISIPGPSAVTAALSVSGFPAGRFLFLGFLPRKKGKRAILKRIVESEETVVFYESCHRILKTLKSLKELFKYEHKLCSHTQLVVCRELTKMFESVYRGDIEKVLDILENDLKNLKGEFVVIADNRLKKTECKKYKFCEEKD